MNEPGSPSSPFTTTYLGWPGARAQLRHFAPVRKPAPPRPRCSECSTVSRSSCGLPREGLGQRFVNTLRARRSKVAGISLEHVTQYDGFTRQTSQAGSRFLSNRRLRGVAPERPRLIAGEYFALFTRGPRGSDHNGRDSKHPGTQSGSEAKRLGSPRRPVCRKSPGKPASRSDWLWKSV